MPTQLYTNGNIEFICARNFTYAGVDYTLGQDFPQEVAAGHLDTLVRSRYLYAVVDSTDQKPRHWHHHIWLRKDITNKLGVLNRSNTDVVTGSSLYNKPKQMELEQPNQDYQVMTPWDETTDNAEALKNKAHEAALTEKVLDQENADEDSDENEQTEPQSLLTDEKSVEERTEERPAETQEVKDDEGNVVIGSTVDEDDDKLLPGLEADEDEVTEDELYDPSKHSVNDVLDYLTGDITEEERQRVLAAEANGKNRKGILNV